MVTLKIKLGDDTRRVTFDGTSISELRLTLNQLFPNLRDPIIKYRDEDDDLVTITTTQELQEALNVSSKTAGILRLILSESSKPSSSASSTSEPSTSRDLPRATTSEPNKEDSIKNSTASSSNSSDQTSSSSEKASFFDLSSLVSMISGTSLAPLLPQLLSNASVTNIVLQLLSNPMIRSNVVALLSNPAVCTVIAQFAPSVIANPALLASILPMLSGLATPPANPNVNQQPNMFSGFFPQATSNTQSSSNAVPDFSAMFGNFFAPPSSSSASSSSSSQSNTQKPAPDFNAMFQQFGQMYNQFADQVSTAFAAPSSTAASSTSTKSSEKNNTTTAASTPVVPPTNSTTEPVAAPASSSDATSSTSSDTPVLYAGNFIQDVTVVDGTPIAANQTFPKIWKFQNTGRTTWPAGTTLVYETGDRLSEFDSIVVANAQPGESVDVLVLMKAPSKPGRYISYWRLSLPNGTSFGQRVWADILVTQPESSPVVEVPSVTPAQVPVSQESRPTAPQVDTPMQEASSDLQFAPQFQSGPEIVSVDSLMDRPNEDTPVYSEGVQQLIDMGFQQDPQVLQDAINRHNGNLVAVIQEIIG